MFPANTFL